MNDSELSTAVRESVARVHSATPVAQIISRGRAVRARRRAPGVAGALTAAAGTALAVTALLPSGHPALVSSGGPAGSGGPVSSGHPGRQPATVRLAAWTVARQANGDIDVTINQLKDPAGLQATLRADGLPANVTFSGSLSSVPCQPYQAGALNAVTQINGDDLVIDPSALPSGAGVAIFDEPGRGLPTPSGDTPTFGTPPAHPSVPPLLTALDGPLAVGLVYASQQCTG
jgi:hypothetical protein